MRVSEVKEGKKRGEGHIKVPAKQKHQVVNEKIIHGYGNAINTGGFNYVSFKRKL